MPSQIEHFRSQQDNPEVAGVMDIDPSEVWEKRAEVVIVDVRRPDEFTGELGHVPGSQLMVLDVLPDHLAELPAEKTIVFVCRSGRRSAQATAYALSEGFKSVYNMKGGMLLWNEVSLPVEGRSES